MWEVFFSILLSFLCYLCKANEVPSEIITSVTLTFDPMVGVLGSPLQAKCVAELDSSVSGCIIDYDYGFSTKSVGAGAGVKATNIVNIATFNLSLAGKHTCTVTVIPDGDFCTVNDSGHAFSPKTSTAVTLMVKFPSDLITAVTLSFKQGAVYCNATLSVDVSGAVIEFNYGSVNKNVTAVAGTTQIHVTFNSLNQYNCTVTVTAPGVCGVGGSEPACPTKTSVSVLPPIQVIAMEVQVTSNRDKFLDVAPFNYHTLNCTVNTESSVTDIDGTLVFLFIKNGDMVHTENKSISHPGMVTVLKTLLEDVEGISSHTCNVTLFVNEHLINNSIAKTTVEVAGPKSPAIPMWYDVHASTSSATVSWNVSEVVYTPESYTVYYAPYGSCSIGGSDLADFDRSITMYTPNNDTFDDFFYEKDMKFSAEFVGLEPSTGYCGFVVGRNTYGKTTSKMFSFETTSVENDPNSSTQVDSLLIASISGGGLVITIVCSLVIVTYCVCHKKRSSKFKVSAQQNILASKTRTESVERLELKPVDIEPEPPSIIYKNIDPVSVDDFPHYVKNRGKIAIQEEHKDLQNFEGKPHEAAMKNENKPRNRFQDIYPFDDSRVTLKLILDDDSSDYINASFVGNYSQRRAYIAAQGPKPRTVDDFWRMVWEYELPTIVMLTQLEESGKEKCACYWPEDGSDTKYLDNELDLKLLKQTMSPSFITRKFRLTKIGDNSRSPLSVTQYHFTAWPDHGVPDDKTCITSFISFVRKKHPPSGPPLLVHCSAGVGRTGTFIVLDTMLQRIKEEGTIDIRGCVNQIRTHRVNLVQTELQYVYIYEVLAEYLVCGDTSFAVMNARIQMHKLGKKGFQKQFQLLEDLGLTPFDPSMSDAESYPEKNRYTYNLPYNMNRVRLRVMENNYINASWINGYKHRGMFLATQLPMEETTGEFWRMVWENNSQAIVMLCLPEEGEDDYNKKQLSFQYWPREVNNKETFGIYEVVLTSEQPGNDYITRKLTITNADKNERSTVTQYHYLQWPEGGKPKATASLLKMVADLVKTQSSTGNRGITVMCNDGVGRTGAFICIYSQLERIKTEATADIFQCVKSARLQRAGLVRTLDEYVFCYEVVTQYNDEMSLYDNFKYDP